MNKIIILSACVAIAFSQTTTDPTTTNQTTESTQTSTGASVSSTTNSNSNTDGTTSKSIIVAHNVSFEEIGTVPLRKKVLTPVTEKISTLSRFCPASVIMKASCPTPEPCPEIDSLVCQECPVCENNPSNNNINVDLISILREALLNKNNAVVEQTTTTTKTPLKSIHYVGDVDKLSHTIKLTRERRDLSDYSKNIAIFKNSAFYNTYQNDTNFMTKINNDLSEVKTNSLNETYLEPLKNDSHIVFIRNGINTKYSQLCQEAIYSLDFGRIMFELIYGYNYKNDLYCQIIYSYAKEVPDASTKKKFNVVIKFKDIFMFKFCKCGKLSLNC